MIDINDLLKVRRAFYAEPDTMLRRTIFEGFKQVELANLLTNKLFRHVQQPEISRWATGRVKLPLDAFITLLDVRGISFSSVRKRFFIYGASGQRLRASILPILPSPVLAYLVGKTMGDGSLSVKDHTFAYHNSSPVLMEAVRLAAQTVFGISGTMKRGHNAYYIVLPRIIGDILQLAGAPLGNKVACEFRVPKWIRDGNADIKAAFLRALFDDEAWTERYRIGMSMAKKITFQKNLADFMSDVQMLLERLGVRVQTIYPDRIYKVEGVKHIQLRMCISSRRNLQTFTRKVGFEHPQKLVSGQLWGV